MLAAKSLTSRVAVPTVRPRRTTLTVRCDFINENREHSKPKRHHAPLIERLGGPAGVRAAVDIFYGKVRALVALAAYARHYYTLGLLTVQLLTVVVCRQTESSRSNMHSWSAAATLCTVCYMQQSLCWLMCKDVFLCQFCTSWPGQFCTSWPGMRTCC